MSGLHNTTATGSGPTSTPMYGGRDGGVEGIDVENVNQDKVDSDGACQTWTQTTLPGGGCEPEYRDYFAQWECNICHACNVWCVFFCQASIATGSERRFCTGRIRQGTARNRYYEPLAKVLKDPPKWDIQYRWNMLTSTEEGRRSLGIVPIKR